MMEIYSLGASNGTFVRNSESCRAYYYCTNGTAHRNQCPEGFVFEPVRQLCDIPSRVDCTGKIIYNLVSKIEQNSNLF